MYIVIFSLLYFVCESVRSCTCINNFVTIFLSMFSLEFCLNASYGSIYLIFSRHFYKLEQSSYFFLFAFLLNKVFPKRGQLF